MISDIAQRTIDEAAADWDVRLRSHRCTANDRDKFNAWLERDFRHRAAYERLQSGLATLCAASDHPQLRALSEVASLAERRATGRHRFTAWAMAAGIAALALTVGVLSWHWSPMPQIALRTAVSTARPRNSATEALVTAATERRAVSLPDGSSVTLNASTRIETEWLAHERRIRLLSGQALFRVAKDKTRPFIVTVGDRTVTALGTAFDVRLDADKVQVTLLEGRVAVRGVGKAAHQPTLELTPNQQFIAVDGELPTVQAVDTTRASAWAEGQVYFTDEALPAAVAEMNQHSAQQIVVADPTLSQYRVNGMFRAGNQDGFVGAITSYFPIDARQDADGHIVLRSRPQGAPAH
jgi:transmembrane sensor